MHPRTLAAVLLSLTMIPAAALADSDVSIVLTPDGEQLAADLGETPAELQQDLQDRLAEAYQTARVEDFLKAFSNATSFSNRGIGVDYASDGEGFMFGVAGNVAVSATDLDFDQSAGEFPVGGAAPNVTLMAGLNFAKWNVPKLTVFANGFYRKASVRQLDGSITNFGAHGQYNLFGSTKGKKSLLLKWGGVDLTGGIEYTRWKLSIGDSLVTNFDLAGNNGDSSAITADATGRFNLESSAWVVPVEATTSLRFLYALSVFGGVGFDLQQGSTAADANLTADVRGSDPAGGPDVDVGTAVVTADGESGPSTGRLRFLAGLQVNVWKLKAFVQLNFVPTDTASVAFGLRVVL